MKIARSKISRVVAEKSLKAGVSRKLAREVAAYLLEAGRVKELDSIMRDVQADWAEAGIVDVVATSAFPISDAVRKDIRASVKKLYPKAKQIIINEVFDPEVIAGVRLNLANQQLDLSVETKLNKFKRLSMTGKEA